MQLKKGERALLAYFPTYNDARKAAEELKRAGIEEVRVDRISRFGVNKRNGGYYEQYQFGYKL